MARKKMLKPVTKPTFKTRRKYRVKAAPAATLAAAPITAPKAEHQRLEMVGDLFAVRNGDSATVHLAVDPSITDVTVVVNGRGVWKGIP